MKVIFVSARNRFPDIAAEIRAGIVDGLSVFALTDIKIIAVFTLRVSHGFFKPFVFTGTVIDNQIHQHIHISFLCFCDQFIKFLHSTELLTNGIIIRNIISLINKGRAVDRGKPQNIYTKFFQIIQFRNNATQIANAITVAVHKALWVNLISHLVVPPLLLHIKTS